MKAYKIAIVLDAGSLFEQYAQELQMKLSGCGHSVRKLSRFDRENSYDFVFLLSCSEIIRKEYLFLNHHNLVVHASALPNGKGWSPLTWQILEGKSRIPVTLFEANEHVDAGCIYLQREICFEGTELIDEMRDSLGKVICELCFDFVCEYPAVLDTAREQTGEESFYPRRKPEDSRIDIEQPIRTQMNLLRVVDNERYPAFFDWKGKRYYLAIYSEKKESLLKN